MKYWKFLVAIFVGNCSMLEFKFLNGKTDLIYSVLEDGTKCS